MESIVVIGNGMASQSFCRWLTEPNEATPDVRSADFNVVIYGDEPRPAYDRVNLTDFFTGKSPTALELATRDWYEKRGIQLNTGERVASISRADRTITLESGKSHAYDQLVLATGSRPFVPPLPGVDLPGVFRYRTIEDLEAIAEWGGRSRSAAVLGGGLLGLEAAKALRDMNLVPHVIEMAPGLMPRQLDRESADHLKDSVERMGVHVHLSKRTESIQKHGDFLIIQFDTGESLSVDMVVVSAGIRPCDELASGAGLPIGPRGGIVVNDCLTTEDQRIHAIGECASHRDIVYGLVAPCLQMARVLANRFRGQDDEFIEGDRSAKLKLLGVDVATFGEPLGDAPGTRVVTANLEDASRKLLIRGRQLVGAMGVGPWPEVDRIRVAIAGHHRPSQWALRRFAKRGRLWGEDRIDDVANWPPNALVCSCLQVSQAQLMAAHASGNKTVDALASSTGASTVCGSCRPLLEELAGGPGVGVHEVPGNRGLLVASLVTVLAICGIAFAGPISFSTTVEPQPWNLDFLWRDNFWKQVTGYSLLALTCLSMLLSVRKRWKRFSIGAFGNWRMLHSLLGATTIVGLLLHTGFHLGSNLNFMLMICFVGINFLGGIAGFVAAIEAKASGPTLRTIRQWRPRLTFTHALLLWPLPVLIAAHIFSFYYY